MTAPKIPGRTQAELNHDKPTVTMYAVINDGMIEPGTISLNLKNADVMRRFKYGFNYSKHPIHRVEVTIGEDVTP